MVTNELSGIRSCSLIILLSTAVCSNRNFIWKENVTEENLIYNDGVVFTQQTASAINCAWACQTHSMPCLDFTYTTTTEECRGYDGISHDSVSHVNTKMWRQVCRLDGYTYDPTFRVCIRLYTTARNWLGALEACYTDTAYLLILDTIEKVRATKTGVHKDLFSESDRWWIGGYDNDTETKWINGENIDIPSEIWYSSNQPDHDHEECINLFINSLGINDQTCSHLMYYVCQENI
ncbi:uncharacterized protein LOC117314703 [Pecten maximus]|uniref:uncharacterized protein LOC117314703 n=1 Tax=Pecten maximus TaxID=6579 RepID=UPI0014589602|nr:uncharacterized protein LOC117314703 [Pecten maximus]